ncbi:MAG: flagellar assembly protein T N-terminal domain-containing protein [Marinobacter sp.]|nr:flagellar assembly protein T N-terminal domain-containing protein [Marinobacter sp.]MDX1634211.1 flagellar assembly protein T N-terminal domain-containing protein [Marinobacter sp.]
MTQIASVRRSLACGLLLLLVLVPAAQAVVLEGTGQAVIRNGDLDTARNDARRAALREVALQYEAQIASEETLTNGVLTDSRLTVASRAQARDVRIINEYRNGNLLRVTVRADMSASASCGAGDAFRLRKQVAVTGFPILYPDQARVGRLDDAGEILPQALQAALQQQGDLQVYGATTVRMFESLRNAPTEQRFDNRLTNVVGLARELGVQFVVTGVIRDLGIADPSAWGSSVLDRLQRGVGLVDQSRRFVADLMIYDGFSGTPIYQQRFSTEGQWNAGPGASTGFGSAGFQATDYGQAVNGLLAEMKTAVNQALACQPFMTRITRVDGEKVTLDSGAAAGLRPGDELHLYRSYSYFDAPGATPELRDAEVKVRLDSVHPEFSNGLIPMPAGQANLQRDDLAIIW